MKEAAAMDGHKQEGAHLQAGWAAPPSQRAPGAAPSITGAGMPAVVPSEILVMGQKKHKSAIAFASAIDRQASWDKQLQGYTDQFILP